MHFQPCTPAQIPRFLKNLTVIDPKNRTHMDLSKQKDAWEFLGEALPNIIKREELDTLLATELPAFQRLEPAEEGKEVDEWWAEVSEVSLGDERQFSLLSRFTTLPLTLPLTLPFPIPLTRFALALATVCNSSSEVERDFSDMEAIYADSRANKTGQELLEAKMTIKSHMKNEANYCARCIAVKEDRRKRALAGENLPAEHCKHCHCKFFEVDENLLAKLRNSEPSKKEKEKQKKEREKEKEKKLSEADEKKDKEKEKKRIMGQVLRLRKITKEKKEKAARLKEKKKKAETEKSTNNKGRVVKKSGATKGNVSIKKVDVSNKKKKLAFLLV